MENILMIKDFLLFCEEEEIERPTKEDIETYVTACYYDIVNDDSIENKEEFEEKLVNLLLKTCKFINSL